MVVNIYSICFILIFAVNTVMMVNKTILEICPVYKRGPGLNVANLVGSWMTVYIHPEAVDCFVFRIRATTELEREQYVMKYGNFSNRINWNRCLLQVETSSGKHFLQSSGSEYGLMKNIIITEDKPGEYVLQNVSADQWMVFGRRGSEVLIIRDCYGETAAAFARAPYWPKLTELSAIFHRSDIVVQTHGRSLCEPQFLVRECDGTIRFNRKGDL